MFSLAGDWRITRDSVLEFEVEQSRKTQPSQNGYSLLGGVLPAPVDPRINLNNQPWSQPSEFNALTGSVRFSQALNADWRWSAQISQQRLKTDDRLAYAFGCGAEGNFDRYCSDGTFDVYDFRSENERRTQTAASLNLKGNVMTGSVKHAGLRCGGWEPVRMRNRCASALLLQAGTQIALAVPSRALDSAHKGRLLWHPCCGSVGFEHLAPGVFQNEANQCEHSNWPETSCRLKEAGQETEDG